MIKTVIISIIYAALLCVMATSAYRFGYSQMLADEGRRNGSLALLERAKQTDGSNPAAFDFTGHILQRNGDFAGAARSFSEAIARRPDDYVLWLRFGYALYKAGDAAGAREAYAKSIELAPLYATPNRYMGRLLLKDKQVDNGFVFLRRAAASDDSMIPELLHLARIEFPESGPDIERLAAPSTTDMKLKVAGYLIKYNLLTNSMRDFVLNGLESETQRTYFTERLLKYGNISLARQVWLTSEKASNIARPAGELVFDGGFESPPSTKQNAFGWQTSADGDVIVGLDKGTHRSGNSALRVVLKGKVATDKDLIGQLVPTEKGRAYGVVFGVMSTSIESYGGVYVTIADRESGAVLASSEPFADTSGSWKELRLQFRADSDAVRIAVRRTPCKITPCPIYGDLRFDDISVRAK